MASLRIETPAYDNAMAVSGNTARCWLNGVEISQYVHSLSIDIPVDGPITAQIGIYVGELTLGIAADVELKVPMLELAKNAA